MGAGRKTETYYLPEKSKHASSAPPPINSSLSARNLKKSELGGVIFGCKHNTMKECFEKNLFGLPQGHFSYVRNISPGLPLFLFNYSERKLYGIYEAVSTGGWNIDPRGFTEGGSNTPFPAQVKFKTRMQCQPLFEDQFGPVIAANYYERTLFWFELDQVQTDKLIVLFSSSLMASSSSLHGSTSKKMTLVPYAKAKDAGTEKHASDLKVASQKQVSTYAGSSGNGVGLSYSSVVKNDSPSYSSILKSGEQGSLNEKHGKEALEHSVERERLPTDDQFNSTWEFPGLGAGPNAKLKTSEDSIDESGKSDQQFECVVQRIEDLYSSVAMDDSSSLPQYVPSETLPIAYAECGLGHLPTTITSERNACWPHKSEIGNNCSPEVDLLSNVMLPSDVHYVVDKIQEEVNKLKSKLLRQEEKISSMGRELVLSRTEIKYLKEQLKTSGCIPSQETAYARDSDFESIADESILIIGGFNGLSLVTNLESYCPSRDLLVPLCRMNSTRSYTATVQLKGDVYVIGGFDENLWYDTVESYSVAENKWVTCPSLNRKKGSLAAISLNGKIYAVGGANGVECFSEVELLDLDVGRWIPSRSMLSKRSAPAAAELNGMIYVVGGYDGVNYLKSVERFDPRENAWSRVESMSTKRSCHSVAVFNDKLYAIGGFNGVSMLSTVEVFDPRIGSWIMGESMSTSRGYFSAVVTENSILVIGGADRNGVVLDTVERYEEGYGWDLTHLKAIGKRCKFSAVPLLG